MLLITTVWMNMYRNCVLTCVKPLMWRNAAVRVIWSHAVKLPLENVYMRAEI